MLAKFVKLIQTQFEKHGIVYARVFARSSNVFYQNYDLFVRKDRILLASLLVQRAKDEVSYNDPKWYRNIIFDSDALKTLARLFPEYKIKRDTDALKVVEVYGEKIIDEIGRRMQ